MLKVGIVGYGYWGPNLVRNFDTRTKSVVTFVCDANQNALARVRQRHANIPTTASMADLLQSVDVDAVAIATPVATHFDLAMACLKAGKHVFVEKPIASSAVHARQLIAEAAKRKLILMVDHTFLYTGAVRKIREMVTQGDLGDIYYYDSVRINLGLFQRDVNVLWDLAVHDLSIMDYILPYKPCAVSATGISHVAGSPANTAYVTLFFKEACIAHVQVSWLSPVKIRHTLVGGSRKMIVYNDLDPSEKIRIYDKGITLNSDRESAYKALVGYRMGDMVAPQIEGAEALQVEVEHFIQCIAEGKPPLSDGASGLRVVEILEAATQSMSRRGEPVELR
jgi:predicted dehydrogenase